MDSPNQEPTKENIDDRFKCGFCLEDFQEEKRLLLCKCPANNQNCRNGGCIHCLELYQSTGFNMTNLKCVSCCKPVTNQDIKQVLDAAKEAAARMAIHPVETMLQDEEPIDDHVVPNL